MLFQNFYEFRGAPITCPDCGWSGTGREAAVGEVFAELFEFNCPRCDEKLGICNHPSIADAREKWDLLSEAERRDWEAREDRWQRRQRESLHSEDELPTLEADEIVVDWEYEEGSDEAWYVLRCGDRELFREPAGFEDYPRFEEIVAILMDKYGTRLKDVVPSGAATFFLWGDRLSAREVIADARERVQAAHEGRPTRMEEEREVEEMRIAAAEKEKAFEARCKRGKLRSAEQLPDLDGEELVIIWDWEEGPREEWGGPLRPAWYYVLTCGEKLVWRQPAGWEDYELFGELAAILMDRYGPRLKDLIATPAARGSLGGDRLCAMDTVDDVRQRVQAARRLLYIDMDSALVDFASGVARLSASEAREYAGRLDEVPRIFARMSPAPGALEAVRELAAHYDVRFVSKPRWLDQAAAEDKERWLERRLAGVPFKRFLVPRSTDDRGDYLIDGEVKEKASHVAREVILLGSDDFPDWQSVTAYLLAQRRDWLQLAGDLHE